MPIRDLLNMVLAQSGFLEKQSFFGPNADIDDRQMAAIALKTGRFIRDYYPWTTLRRDAQITLQEGITRYALPNDFKELMPSSIWHLDGSRPAEFPVPDGRWFQYKFSAFSDGGIRRIRKYGSELEILNPIDGQVLAFEYISDHVVRATDGSTKETFTSDDDEWLLNDQLLVDGVQSYWAETKLLPQAQAWRGAFMVHMNEEIAHETGARVAGGDGLRRSNWPHNRSPFTPLWR